jgi:hypothetical protein
MQRTLRLRHFPSVAWVLIHGTNRIKAASCAGVFLPTAAPNTRTGKAISRRAQCSIHWNTPCIEPYHSSLRGTISWGQRVVRSSLAAPGAIGVMGFAKSSTSAVCHESESAVDFMCTKSSWLARCDARSAHWQLQRPQLRFIGLGSTIDFRKIAEAAIAFGECTKYGVNFSLSTSKPWKPLQPHGSLFYNLETQLDI